MISHVQLLRILVLSTCSTLQPATHFFRGCIGTTTKNKASQIISEIRLAKRIKFLTERAKRRGTDPATIERLVSLVRKYNL
jgi:hypothetical protein